MQLFSDVDCAWTVARERMVESAAMLEALMMKFGKVMDIWFGYLKGFLTIRSDRERRAMWSIKYSNLSKRTTTCFVLENNMWVPVVFK